MGLQHSTEAVHIQNLVSELLFFQSWDNFGLNPLQVFLNKKHGNKKFRAKLF